MENLNPNARIIGIVIAIAGALFVLGLVLHPAEGSSVAETQALTALHADAWRASHALAATVFTLFGIVSLFALSSGGPSTLARFGFATTAFGAVVSSAFAIIETGPAVEAALAGDAASFAVWYSLAYALVAVGWTSLCLGLGIVAAADAAARKPITRRWGAVVAALAGGVAAVGALGSAGFGVRALEPLFYATLPLAAYYVWYGIALARSSAATRTMDAPQAVA